MSCTWEDYSQASPWEGFVAEIASVLREWGCADASFLSILPPQKDRIRELEFEGYVYRLDLHCDDAVLSPRWPADRSLRTLAPAGVSMLNGACDFRDQSIARWFGLHQFILASVARPVNAPIGGLFGAGQVTMGRNHGEWLLSSVRLAMRECDASLPAFVVLMDPDAQHYVGACDPGASHGDIATRFETAKAVVHGAPRRSLRSLASLVALFQSKVGPRDNAAAAFDAMSVAARYVWSVNCAAVPIRPLVQRGERRASGGIVAARLAAWAAFEELARGDTGSGSGGSGVQSVLCNALWRPRASLLREFSVVVHFAARPAEAASEALMVGCVAGAATRIIAGSAQGEGSARGEEPPARVAQQPNPSEQAWTMRCRWGLEPDGAAQPLSACFVRLVGMLRRFFESASAMRAAEQQQLVRKQQHQQAIPAERTAAMVGSAIGSGLGMLLRARREAIERSSAADLGIALLAMGLGRKGVESERTAAEAGDAANADLSWLSRSVPAGSLLSQLALHMAELNSIEDVAMLWRMVVEQLRWHWAGLVLLPHVGVEAPSTRCCLLQQKLQMLNSCIHRLRRVRARAGLGTSRVVGDEDDDDGVVDGASGLGGWGEEEGSAALELELSGEDDDDSAEFEDASSKDDEDESEKSDGGDADEEIKEKGEEDGTAVAPPPAVVDEAVSVPTPSTPSTSSTQLLLLRTGAAMQIPELQAPALSTEDMTMAQQDAWLQLGTSDEAAATRQRLQSAALASDMAAFKAANAGCILEDFVRWHSPRDWSSSRSGDSAAGDAAGDDGVLSVRMTQGGDGNLWRATWRRAKAQPASMQTPLFDAAAEGKRALADLAKIVTLDLFVQITQASLSAFYDLLEGSARVAASAAKGGGSSDPASSFSRCDLTLPSQRPLCAVGVEEGHTAHMLGEALVALSRAMQRVSKKLDSLLVTAAEGRREEEEEAFGDSNADGTGGDTDGEGTDEEDAELARSLASSERRFKRLASGFAAAADQCDAAGDAMRRAERIVARVDALQAALVDQDRLVAALASGHEVNEHGQRMSSAVPASVEERAAAVRCLQLTPELASPSSAEYVLRHHAPGGGGGARPGSVLSRLYACVEGSEVRLATAIGARERC